MEISIAQAIHLLLITHPSVSVPGLGTFRADYKPASIDHVGGIIRPPSRFVTFDTTEDAGQSLLEDFLKRVRPEQSAEEIEAAIRTFAEEIRHHPENSKVVEVPELGRFYKNFENKIQFVSDFQEPGKDMHGLPDLQFHPIDRRAEETPAPAVAAPEFDRKSVARERRSWMPALPWIFGFLLLVAASLIYYTWTQNPDILAESARLSDIEVSEAPEKAGTEPADNETPEPAQRAIADEVQDVSDEEENVSQDSDADSDAASLPPGVRKCVIIIGAFSTKEGANAAVRRLLDLGFDVYSDSKRGVTRIGAQLLYDDQETIDQALSYLRREFDPDAFILKK
ncbi:MAG: SPOR domain-containing protein [Saprospiraceae bacterium]